MTQNLMQHMTQNSANLLLSEDTGETNLGLYEETMRDTLAAARAVSS